VFERVGDYRYVEFGSFDIEDGEANAVKADGAFFDDQGAEFFWEFEAEFPGAICVVAMGADSGRVDMALDDVAIETSVDDHAPFKIDEATGLPGAEIGFFEGFIDGGDAVEAVANGFDGQAGSAVGDALVDL